MLKYGFELEGFFLVEEKVQVPPASYPTDGFPGLIEFRSFGPCDMLTAYSQIVEQNIAYPGMSQGICSFVFSGSDRALIRRRYVEKDMVDIQNLYGKAPRLLGNRTIASLQVNVSNLLSKGYTTNNGTVITDRYGLLDIPKIVRRLDVEFAREIKQAGRQPGEYAVKDDVRLEYRSLPNTVFSFNPEFARPFLARLRKAIEGE